MKRVTGKVAKKKNKKNTKLIILIFIILIIFGIVAIKIFPTIKSIDVVIESNEKTTKLLKEEIIELSKLKVGDKLYGDLRSEISNRIEQNPYVKSAEIQRDLSGKLKINVSERKVEYLINYSGEYIYIDEEGYLLEVNPENNDKSIIIGFSTDFSKLSIGNKKNRLNKDDLEKLQIVNNIMSTLKNNSVDNKINSIDVTDKEDFVLNLDNDGKKIYIGDGSNLNTRVLYIKKILQTESGHNGNIYVDEDLDNNYVYFKEQ